METSLVAEATKFMILGMGIVFVFLIGMIVVINIMSKIVHRFFPEPDPTQPPVVIDGEKKTKVVAAIVAAIMEDKKSQA
jgi:oxaloacetate decarboxylase gamma subunit